MPNQLTEDADLPPAQDIFGIFQKQKMTFGKQTVQV